MFPFDLFDRWRAPVPPPEQVGWLGEQDYAHRGLHNPRRIENSMAAFDAAIEGKFGIELDVQRARDGIPVVFHDWTLERLTEESGAVELRSSGDLARICLRGGHGTIPSLRQVLEMVAGRVPVLIEIKTNALRGARPICLAVRRELEGYRGRVAVMGFDPRVSRWFYKNAPAITRGLVVSEEGAKSIGARWRRHQSLWLARPHFLAYDVRDLPSGFAGKQRARGFPVLTWTVKNEEHRERGYQYADAAIFEGAGIE